MKMNSKYLRELQCFVWLQASMPLTLSLCLLPMPDVPPWPGQCDCYIESTREKFISNICFWVCVVTQQTKPQLQVLSLLLIQLSANTHPERQQVFECLLLMWETWILSQALSFVLFLKAFGMWTSGLEGPSFSFSLSFCLSSPLLSSLIPFLPTSLCCFNFRLKKSIN